MREYIEKQIEILELRIEDESKRYRGELHDIREQAERNFSTSKIDKFDGTTCEVSPYSGMSDDSSWVRQAIDGAKRSEIKLYGLQNRWMELRSLLTELDKYESPGTVTVDDAARKIVSNMKQARLHAKGLTLKKDEADRRYYHGLEDAYQKALLEMGYTDAQIEEMMK